VVRQAVSWARAAQDGVWIVSAAEPAQPVAEPHYDYDFISGLERLLREREEGWRQLYEELDVVPHEVVYEDLTDPQRYSECLAEVLRHLDLDVGLIPSPRTDRQADRIK
jgi:LPS sulfotransferase NodH